MQGMRYLWQPCAAMIGPSFSACRVCRQMQSALLALVTAVNVAAWADEVVVYTPDPDGPNVQVVPQDGAAAVDGAFQGDAGDAIVWCLIQGQIDYADQFRPMLDCELAFVRQICGELSVEERRSIKIAGEIALYNAAKRYKKQQEHPNAEKAAAVEPAVLIREAVAAAVRDAVAPELSERFAIEALQRANRRKRAAIMDFVACVDRLVCLSREQRETLMASLSSEWQNSWESWIQLTAADAAWVPRVPDDHLQCLSEEQMSLWKVAPKSEVSSSSFSLIIIDHDDAWWGTDVKEVVPRILDLVEATWETWVSPPAENRAGPVVAPVIAAPIVVAEPVP